MVKGYPDYAAPYGEALLERGYVEYFERYGGDVAGGNYADLYSGAIPAGYNIEVSMASMSANGCEAYHMSAVYLNGALKKAYYFEVNHLFQFARYMKASGGDTIVNRIYNYDDSTRTFEVFLIGILYLLSTPPLKPRKDPGEPPELKPDETLFLLENPWEGKVWRKVKNKPIPKSGWERYHPPLFLPQEVE